MNDTLIFLVLAGIAVIFKWLSSRAADESEKPPPDSPNESIPRAPAQSEEERVRRFLEALGQPSGTQLPPRVRPRGRVEPRASSPTPRPPKVKRGWVQPLPPLTTVPPPERRVTETAPPPLPTPPRPQPVRVAGPIVRPEPKVAPAQPAISFSLGKTLRSPRGLRELVVLREILGPPRGLQAWDDLRSF